jgi:signal transduction histidine kinase
MINNNEEALNKLEQKESLNPEEFRNFFDGYSRRELGILWIVVIVFLIAYATLGALKVPFGSEIYSKILYVIFVTFNIIGAMIGLKSWIKTPVKSLTKDTIMLFSMSIACAAIGNFLDLVFWLTKVAEFKHSIFTNLFFVFAILFCLPAVHLLGTVCKVEFNKQPLYYYLVIISIYISIPLLMNPENLEKISLTSNLKEFVFGMLYAFTLGYLAANAMHLWNQAQGKLMYPTRLLCIGLVLMSLGCAIYAGLFPRMAPTEIPSSPVHIIIALSYMLSGLGISRIYRTIQAVYSLDGSKLPAAQPLIELFGPSKGLEFYSRLENQIVEKEAALLKSEIEAQTKQEMISELEAEVTKRKKIEKDLLKAKEKAEEANKAKSMFLAMMSHELKTPLTAIKGYGQLLQDPDSPLGKKVPDSINKMGEQIYINSSSLQSMIEAILNFSQLESRNFTFERNLFPLSEVKSYLELIVKQSQKNSKANFICSYPDKELTIKTDKISLQNIIANLIINAFKFCQAGQISLEITENSNDLIITVTDEGIGIPEESLKNIFVPFFQVSHGNKRKFGGTGLGLSIVKKLTEELGGSIKVESKIDKGSKFTVELPGIIVKGNTDE